MNTKLNVLLAAGVLALAACNSPTAEQKAEEAAVQADVAGDQAAAAADAAGDAAAASAEAAAAAGAAAVGSAAAAVDAAADPVQAAYEEGKANAAGAIASGAQNVADSMSKEAAEAKATRMARPQAGSGGSSPANKLIVACFLLMGRIDPSFTPALRFLTDHRIGLDIDPDALDQHPNVVQMRARRRMEVVLGHARR